MRFELWGGALATVLIGLLLVGSMPSAESTAAPATPPAAAGGAATPVEDIGWEAVREALAAQGASAASRRAALNELEVPRSYAALFLRSMLLFADGRVDEARDDLSVIPPHRIPVPHAYGAFRLHEAAYPGSANPYRETLEAARQAKLLPPLIAARMAVRSGDLRAALNGYTASDPGDWAVVDIGAFQALCWHAGYRPDCRALLGAALRAGRIPDRHREAVVRILTPDEEAAEQALRDLRTLLEGNESLLRMAVEGARRQLQLRRLFLQSEYDQVLAIHRESSPLEVIDSTLVLLVAAAAGVGDSTALDLWGQELRRRYSDPAVADWIDSLRQGSL